MRICSTTGRRPRVAALRRIVLGAALLLCAPARAGIDYVWQDTFTAAERDKLTAWVDDTAAALARLVGPFPMDVQVHFHRRDSGRGPVPWANTQRYGTQGVHFHVDAGQPAEAFRRDWTAPHELSHLILPYLGRQHAWFAEGFASYLQYPVMQELGVLSEAEARRRYQRNFERAARGFDHPGLNFVEAAPRLRAERKYPVMYWGGAAYFRQVDDALAARGSSLTAVLQRYLACCRRNRSELEPLLAELDRLAGAAVFSERYRVFRTRPGFPSFEEGDAGE